MSTRNSIIPTALLIVMAAAGRQPVQAQDLLLTTEPAAIAAQEDAKSTDSLWFERSGMPELKVSPNIRNETIRDAIKNIIGKADVTYEVDADVPADTRISLKADNILLTTAINVLTESAGIGCLETRKATITDTTGNRKLTKSTVHLHFVKRQTAPLGRSGASWLFNGPNAIDLTGKFNGLNSITTISPDALKGLNNLTTISPDALKGLQNLTTISPDALKSLNNLTVPKVDYQSIVGDALKSYTVDPKGMPSLLYNLRASEERSTFTCPHCHQQVTVIKKRTTLKCPTCGRTFQDDWKFCPFDGAKRPDDTSDWKFCPHCGKPVSELTLLTSIPIA